MVTFPMLSSILSLGDWDDLRAGHAFDFRVKVQQLIDIL